MPLVRWNAGMSVGVMQFDAQHRKLVEILNKLHDAMKDGRSAEVLDGILFELVDYTVYHFLAEERYFLQLNYPGHAAHKREHDAFTARIKAARGHCGNAATLEILGTLTGWLQNHILGTDKLYSPFFAMKKVA
jgi:hemerythrin